MSERRYCRRCQSETLHDKTTSLVREDVDDGPFVRLFFGLCTVGFSELLATHYWNCQRCGHKVELGE